MALNVLSSWWITNEMGVKMVLGKVKTTTTWMCKCRQPAVPSSQLVSPHPAPIPYYYKQLVLKRGHCLPSGPPPCRPLTQSPKCGNHRSLARLLTLGELERFTTRPDLCSRLTIASHCCDVTLSSSWIAHDYEQYHI